MAVRAGDFGCPDQRASQLRGGAEAGRSTGRMRLNRARTASARPGSGRRASQVDRSAGPSPSGGAGANRGALSAAAEAGPSALVAGVSPQALQSAFTDLVRPPNHSTCTGAGARGRADSQAGTGAVPATCDPKARTSQGRAPTGVLLPR
jgi:hypothetical protein